VPAAPDVESALAALREHDFDLVILDINLPDQTGWDVLREALHEGTLHPHELDGSKLPVVVLSAVQVSPRRLAEFRPVAYLPKPFPLDALLRLAAKAESRKVDGAATGREDTPGTSTDEEELHA
jgi:CheY-like chemotaxis protein